MYRLDELTYVKRLASCRLPGGGWSTETLRYWIPPNLTIASIGAGSKPASTARTRVTVKSAAGSKFMLKLSSGDWVMELGTDSKSVSVSIVPKVMPWEATEDEIFLIRRGAEKGFLKDTVTWLILFSRPVVGRTLRTALSRRLAFNPGSVTSIWRVLNASARDGIFVLPSKPKIERLTSISQH